MHLDVKMRYIATRKHSSELAIKVEINFRIEILTSRVREKKLYPLVIITLRKTNMLHQCLRKYKTLLGLFLRPIPPAQLQACTTTVLHMHYDKSSSTTLLKFVLKANRTCCPVTI